MRNPDRPQAPGYLANLMARLFHDVAGAGLAPLGIAPAMFPVLIELWFGSRPVSRQSLAASQEMEAAQVDDLVAAMASAGLIERLPEDPAQAIMLTATGSSLRDPAVASARLANTAAAAALSDAEMVTFVSMMNRIIDRLQEAKGQAGPKS